MKFINPIANFRRQKLFLTLSKGQYFHCFALGFAIDFFINENCNKSKSIVGLIILLVMGPLYLMVATYDIIEGFIGWHLTIILAILLFPLGFLFFILLAFLIFFLSVFNSIQIIIFMIKYRKLAIIEILKQ